MAMDGRKMSLPMGDGRMHVKIIRAALAAMVLVAVATSPVFGQEEPAEPYTGNAGSLVVLPYFTPPGSLPPEYAFSVFTVTDVIRLTLLEQNRFALVEKSEIDTADNALELPDDWPEDELLCVQLSLEVHADYLIRGYVAWMGDALKVFHILIDVASGRTLHMSERVLGSGPAIVKEIEDSARDFSLYVSRVLPDRKPETVIVETEKIVVQERVIRERNPYSLEAGLAVSVPLLNMAQYLAPSYGLRLGFFSSLPALPGLELGVGVQLHLLDQKQAFFIESGQNIDVLFVPVYLTGRWRVFEKGIAALELSSMVGPAIVFGLVSPEVISYFRPTLAAGMDMVMFPQSAFSVSLGCVASATFYIYEQLHMFALEPRMLVRYTH
jgi:hypothetical protein